MTETDTDHGKKTAQILSTRQTLKTVLVATAVLSGLACLT